MPGNEDNHIYDTEDFATALIRFHNGSTLQLTSSWNVNGAEDDRILVNLYGSQAGISLDPPALYGIDEHILTTTQLPVTMGDPHTLEMHHFIESIRSHQAPKSPIADAVTVTAMLVAIAESSAQATAVTVDAT
jgi:predicted dehydrogenase